MWAKRILAEQRAFKAEVAAVQSGTTGALRLGSAGRESSAWWNRKRGHRFRWRCTPPPEVRWWFGRS